MTDVVDKLTRSRMMAGIRGKNTRPEIILRRALHANGFRFRLHARRLPGKPDIVFPRYQAVCFVHGCFWHRHSQCRYAATPATRPEFWEAKFRANVAGDMRNRQILLEAGWRVAVVWECALRRRREGYLADRLGMWLRGQCQEFDSDRVLPPDGRKSAEKL